MTTRAEWRERILQELGGSGVDAELDEAQLDAALRAALDLWNHHRPERQWFPFDIPTTGSETYVITFFADPERTDPRAHPNTYIRNVIDVTFQDVNRMMLGARATGTEGYYLRWGHEGPRLFFEMQSARRTYERLTGTRPDFHWEPNERKLYITSPARPVRAMVLATRERTLEDIPYDYVSDFLRAATAKAKYYLARMLGSRGPIPGATSTLSFETDAKELREESHTEWEQVRAKLAVAIPSLPPPQYIG